MDSSNSVKTNASSYLHKYNTRSKQSMKLDVNGKGEINKGEINKNKLELNYKSPESSDEESSYEEDTSDEDMYSDISTDEDDTDIEEEEEEEEEEDEDDEDDDFIVNDDSKSFNHRAFQQILSGLFPSNYMNEKVKNIKGQKKDKQKKDKQCKDKNRRSRESAPSPRECSTPKEGQSPPLEMSRFNIIFAVKPPSNEYNDEMANEEMANEEMANEEMANEEMSNEEMANDKMANEEMANEEMANDKMANYSEVIGNKCIRKLPTKYQINEKKRFKQQEYLCKKRKYKNTLKFRELLQQKNVMNDLNYFQEKMSLDEQIIVLQQMEEIKSIIDIEKPYRLALLEANIPVRFKACAYNKLSALKNMEPGCSEYNKIRHWVDDFMRIPFNKINHLPVRLEDGVDKCHDFMENAKNTLDKAVYGLNDVKLQVMQMVGQWITNPDAIGNSVAIEGPPGTGKTTLVKEGISKILNREFVFIPLGGATDSSCLEGHSYTYEGSNCGLIVKQLIQCQSMNPIIYFDELDKISDTPKGDEIVGILTHLTDTSQNSKFHDKYFAEFDFDLSRCVFFFSYNDRSKVNRILLDRMHCIMTKGYELPQKTIISKDYLLPIIREQVRFNDTDIILTDETIHHIINTHTHKEDGVRNLKRCLEIIHTKLNLYRLMKPDTNLFESDMSIKVEFPITITPKIVDKLIKTHTEAGSWKNMYM
jgi:pentapeptide MXKDX repeat protein